MRAWKLLTLLTASAVCLPLPALGAECRILAESDRQLVLARDDGSTLAALADGEHGWITAASFSPDGRYILYSDYPAMYGGPAEIHLAEVDGSEVAVLRVTSDENRIWDIESISDIDWFDDHHFWTFGRFGRRGVYVDVWKIDPRFGFATSELESRLAAFGGPCTFSPELELVACAYEDELDSAIFLYDYRKAVDGKGLPEVDPSDDYDAFVLAVRQGAERDTAAEGLTWDPEHRRLLFVVRGTERLELGTLEGHGEGTGGWNLHLRALTGIGYGVEAIRARKGGFELLTGAGPFWVGRDSDEASTHEALEARAVETPEVPRTPALKKLTILDRWCPGGRE